MMHKGGSRKRSSVARAAEGVNALNLPAKRASEVNRRALIVPYMPVRGA